MTAVRLLVIGVMYRRHVGIDHGDEAVNIVGVVLKLLDGSGQYLEYPGPTRNRYSPVVQFEPVPIFRTTGGRTIAIVSATRFGHHTAVWRLVFGRPAL